MKHEYPEIGRFEGVRFVGEGVGSPLWPWLLPNGKVALETLPYAKGVRRFRQRQVVRACKYLIEPPKFDFAWMYQ